MNRSKIEPDFIARYGYDANIDYREMINVYNDLVKQGKVDDAKSLMKKHGGILAVIGKLDYQKGRQQ